LAALMPVIETDVSMPILQLCLTSDAWCECPDASVISASGPLLPQ